MSSLSRHLVAAIDNECFFYCFRAQRLLVLASAVILGQEPMEFMTIFYYLTFYNSPTWLVRPPYLYRPGTGWPSSFTRRWIPFLSPPTSSREMLEVDSQYVTCLGQHRK
jgi:hypothetical protein